ncbi:MAG TPA: hypothetical protein DCK93_11560 [Blastocatellia bacterium]|nr:hypothetical protein [Blastocatellia bacterium]
MDKIDAQRRLILLQSAEARSVRGHLTAPKCASIKWFAKVFESRACVTIRALGWLVSPFHLFSERNYFNRRTNFLLRSFLASTVFFALLLGCTLTNSAAFAQRPAKPATTDKTAPKNEKVEKVDKNQKNYTAQQIAESAIFIYGSRPLLTQIRRNGVERGRICKPTCDVPGKTEEASYERKFVRGDSVDKDKIRLDQKMPTLEYSLVYGGGQLWGIINGAAFIPRQDAVNTFLAQHRHSIDTFLRYKENGSTLSLVGRDKQKGLDLYVLDVVDKDKQSTRFYISAKSLHVLWLEYEEATDTGAPGKYTRRFFDYRLAQGTLVPYKTVLMEEGKQTQEIRILNVTFGIKLDDSLFKSPEA